MRRAVAVAEKSFGPDHAIVATNLNNLAGLLQTRNQLAEAEPLMRRALAITEKSLGPDHPNVAASLDYLAGVLQITNRLTEAEPLLRRAVEIDEKAYGPDHPNVAGRLTSLAVLLQFTNRPAEAESLLRRALEIDERSYGRDHPNVAVRLTGLALLLQTRNRFAEAEALLRRALEIDEKAYGPNHPNVAARLTALAIILQNGNRLSEAEAQIRRAVAIFEEGFGPDHPQVATSLAGLAQILQATNRLNEAEPLMRRALAIFEKSYGPDSYLASLMLKGLAELLQAANRLDEAEPLLRRAIAILEKAVGPDHPLLAASVSDLAALKEAQGDWQMAAAFYARAKPGMIGFRNAAIPGGSQFGKANLAQNSGNLRSYARALKHASPSSAKSLAEAFELAQWALQNEAADALSLMSLRFAKGKGRLASLVRNEQDLRAALENAYRQLDQAAGQANASAAASARAAIASVGSKLDSTRAALRRSFKDYAELANPAPLGIVETQALLSKRQALVLFLDLYRNGSVPEETLVFAVTKKQARWASLPAGAEALRRRVMELRCGLDFSNWRPGQQSREICKELLGTEVSEGDVPPFDASAAYALYRDLFGGMEDLIENKSLLIVPSGALTQLPFEALVTEKPDETLPRFEAYKKARWFGQRQAITVLPSVGSLNALRNARASAAQEPFIGIGNPLLDGPDGTDRSAWSKQSCANALAPEGKRFGGRTTGAALLFRYGQADVDALRHQPPLPETADELCQVAQALGVPEGRLGKTVYLGERATVTGVKTLSENGALARARVVHFATHGLLAGETALFAKNKAEPALLLTPPVAQSDEDNGLLTASEVAQLNLNADWVIMSACNTAAGQAEGAEALSGLARAFFYAGARSLLVSHWEVNSQAAVAITTGAVLAMKAEPRIGRAEALKRSISALIERRKGWDHPSVWAPFVLVGNAEQ
jgi:CHAT domain-containing protein